MKSVLVFLLVVFSSVVFADAGDNVPWIDFPPFNHMVVVKWAPVLTDIMQHEAPGDSNHYDDLITLGHETSHGIHAYIRNHLGHGQHVNGFYVPGNHAVLIEEPNMRKRDIIEFIPQALRGDRYKLYVQGQTEWDDTPLYIFDEWNAYINGGCVGVDQVQKNLWHEDWQDGVAGQLEFNVYAIAVAMAAQKHDPHYLETNVAFKEFLAYNLIRSMECYKLGSAMTAFAWDKQEKYLEAWRTGSDASAIRDFTRQLFGDAWCKDHLGY